MLCHLCIPCLTRGAEIGGTGDISPTLKSRGTSYMYWSPPLLP